MKNILIIQSCRPNPPHWIGLCMHSVEAWAHLMGYNYLFIPDTDFMGRSVEFSRFPIETRSDFSRLQIMRTALCGAAAEVYWIDPDFLVWDRWAMSLPIPESAAVVCARQVKLRAYGTEVTISNSILGLSDPHDADILIELAELKLRHASPVTFKPTVIGSDLFSSSDFPLRQIIATQAGCFSPRSIRKILGPYLSGRNHLFWLGIANGETLAGAKLCPSSDIDEHTMTSLVNNLTHGVGDIHEIGVGRYFSLLYRTWLRLHYFLV